MSWQFFSSSVTGVSHYSTSTPCQDKHSVVSSADGKWLAAVVSDGAGSAKYAEIGAETTVKIFCESLIALSSELNTRTPGTWINDFLIEKILALRQQLRIIAGKDEINEYHCTLVAALVGEKGGFSIHIGDGHITGGNFELLNDGKINLNSNNINSLPENGEYANETFFVTEGNWVKHIRVSPLPPLDWIALTSDGGSSLLFDGKDKVKSGFLIPVLGFALDEPQSASKVLTTTISDPKANQLTSDDKTIVVAYRKNKMLTSERIIYKESEQVTTEDKSSVRKSKNDSLTQTAKNTNETLSKTLPTKSSLIIKFYKFKLITKYLAALVIAALLFFTGLFLYQWNESKDINNPTPISAHTNKNRDSEEPNIPASSQPASELTNSNQEKSKETPAELPKTLPKTIDTALDKGLPNSVSGELKKQSVK
jgi:serine/threonine protein phosphatase PrpC